jgi:hypothetical protein
MPDNQTTVGGWPLSGWKRWFICTTGALLLEYGHIRLVDLLVGHSAPLHQRLAFGSVGVVIFTLFMVAATEDWRLLR